MTTKAYPQDSDGRFMDLRDYFAAQMMPKFTFSPSREADAKEIYKIADAMLKAREVK